MDISLRQLEAFIKVAEHRSFSKAGDELFLSQSTISSHVAQLEQSLQVTLIKRREKKNIELTEEGQRAYRAAQIIINQAEMLQNMFRKEEADFQKIIDIIRAIRNQRTEMNIPPSKKAKVYIETAEATVFTDGIPFLQRLASASEVEVGEKFELPGAVQIITHAARALIPMDELIDREKELARLEKEREKCQSDIDFIGRKLDNPGFVAKAPAQLIEAERAKLAQHKDRMEKILESIAAMQK